MDPRLEALQQWLTQTCDLTHFNLQMLPGDASFRRYFRVQLLGKTYIAMDAPPDREKNCLPFVKIAQGLRQYGVVTPEIFVSDLEQGFLLMSDFGDRVFLREINLDNATHFYHRALDTLGLMQQCQEISEWQLPFFTANFIYDELQIFKHWFLQVHLKLNLSAENEKMLAEFFSALAESAANQPQVFMHRDFHSGNLMILPENKIGVLDFQDAFIGPITYDLVSLLRDCYVVFPNNLITDLVLDYHAKLSEMTLSRDEFLYRFDLMGLQRHLKALLTFVRKYHRDGHGQYLKFILPTLNYIHDVSAKYPVSKKFHEFLLTVVFPALEGGPALCEQ